MSGLKAYVKSLMGTKFESYNEYKDTLKNKYGKPEEEYRPSSSGNPQEVRYVETFYKDNKKVAEAYDNRLYSSDKKIPQKNIWEYSDNEYIAGTKCINDYTTGLTYRFPDYDDKANYITVKHDGYDICIKDSNGNGEIDEKDDITIIEENAYVDASNTVTVGEYLNTGAKMSPINIIGDIFVKILLGQL